MDVTYKLHIKILRILHHVFITKSIVLIIFQHPTYTSSFFCSSFVHYTFLLVMATSVRKRENAADLKSMAVCTVDHARTCTTIDNRIISAGY